MKISSNSQNLLTEFIGGSIEFFGPNADDLLAVNELVSGGLVRLDGAAKPSNDSGAAHLYLSLTEDGEAMVAELRRKLDPFPDILEDPK
jgi:hypothetical protein